MNETNTTGDDFEEDIVSHMHGDRKSPITDPITDEMLDAYIAHHSDRIRDIEATRVRNQKKDNNMKDVLLRLYENKYGDSHKKKTDESIYHTKHFLKWYQKNMYLARAKK